jgi:hypothetical protein
MKNLTISIKHQWNMKNTTLLYPKIKLYANRYFILFYFIQIFDISISPQIFPPKKKIYLNLN